MHYEVCSEHVTVFAFTGITWCGNCIAIKDDLEQLAKDATQSQDFHYVQFDDSTDEGMKWSKAFEIAGVPTFLIHDPRAQTNRALVFYDGNRSAADIARCARNRTCTGRPQSTNVIFDHKAHNTSSATKSSPKRTTVGVCANDPSWIVFTADWCGACSRAKPTLVQLKQQLGDHVNHMDVDAHQAEFDALQLKYLPSFLYYDPATQQLFKVPTDHVLMPRDNTWQRWDVPDGVLEPTSCSRSMTGACPSMAGACPSMVGACPSMAGACPSMAGACPSMAGELPASLLIPLDTSVTNPRVWSLQDTDTISECPVVLDVCKTCVTFVVFTGTDFCMECKMFFPELIKLKQMARCGSFHVTHFDIAMASGSTSDARRMARALQVTNVPTVLVFDPSTFGFHPYTGLLQAQDMQRVPNEMRHYIHKTIPVPKELTFRIVNIVDKKQPQRVQMRMCSNCPTVLIFAYHPDKYAHVVKEDGQKIHVQMFKVPDQRSRVVLDAFKIDALPKVLIYNPLMGNFRSYDGNIKDTPKTAESAFACNGRVWKDHPYVLLQN